MAVNRQNVKKQLCQVLLYIKEGLGLVANVFKSFLATYLARKFDKRVVLLVPMPNADIGITASLLKLRNSNSRHNIGVNWLTRRHVQLQNRAACSAETSTSILPLEMYGDIEVEISTEHIVRFCN